MLEVLGDHSREDHLSHEEIESLDLKVVTEGGGTVPEDEARAKILRIVDPDGPSGHLVLRHGDHRPTGHPLPPAS